MAQETTPATPGSEAQSKPNPEPAATETKEQAPTEINSTTKNPSFLDRRKGEEVYESQLSSSRSSNAQRCNGTLSDGLGKVNHRKKRDVRRWLLIQMRGPHDEAEYQRRVSAKKTPAYGSYRYARK
ncbi:hypothetical protein PC116_g29992 [Phytophthora cactorum]|nr:hypothetical protein PC116_g29992 [Phytophthora cactorum]